MAWEWKTVGKKREIGSYAHWFDTMERPFLPEGLGLDGEANLNILRQLRSYPNVPKTVAGSVYLGGAAVPLPADVVGGSLGEQEWKIGDIKDKLPKVPDDTVITGIIDVGISLAHMLTRFETHKTRFAAIWQQGATTQKDDKGNADQVWLPSGREIYHAEIDAALERYSNPEGTVDEDAFNRELGISDPLKPIANRELERASSHGTHVLDLAAGHAPDTDARLRERHRIIAVNLPAQFAHGSAGNFLAYFAVYGLARLLFLADALWEKNHNCGPQKEQTYGYPIVVNFSYGMRAGPKDGYHIFEQAMAQILKDRNVIIEGAGANPSPVRVIMPIGNENLERGAASCVLGEEGVKEPVTGHEARERIELNWRVLPDDATPNFVELWTQGRRNSRFRNLLDRDLGLHIWVTPPGQAPLRLDRIDQHDSFQDLTDGNKSIARVYVNHVSHDDTDRSRASNTIGMPPETEVRSGEPAVATDGKTQKHLPEGKDEFTYRLALLICIAPTLRNAPPNQKGDEKAVAPAGAWTIRVDYDGDPVDATLYVQSDQSAVQGSKMGKKSYFDHPAYRVYLSENERDRRMETGARADTYSYDRTTGGRPIDNDDWQRFGPVQRRGSHNAISSVYLYDVTAVGSYDDSDGMPASYSATPDGNPQRRKKRPDTSENRGRDALTVVYPGENAPSLFGLLAAGTRDGSVVPYRGTSMSTALAARDAALAFLHGDPSKGNRWNMIGREKWFRRRAAWNERKRKRAFKEAPAGKTQMWELRRKTLKELKIGDGRLSDPRDGEGGRLPRLGAFD